MEGYFKNRENPLRWSLTKPKAVFSSYTGTQQALVTCCGCGYTCGRQRTTSWSQFSPQALFHT